jgi:hypothetical protein
MDLSKGQQPKGDNNMRQFLIFLPLTEEHTQLHERVLATAKTFFEAVAPVERQNLGTFQRSSRPNRPTEILPLVVLSSPADKTFERDVTRARALEAVLRSTLGAAGVNPVDVRVFVDTPTAEAVV